MSLIKENGQVIISDDNYFNTDENNIVSQYKKTTPNYNNYQISNYSSMICFNKIYIAQYFNYVNFVIILITIIAYYLHA